MMRILFITSNRLGDAVISTGLLADLLDHIPDAEVTVACGPVAASLFAPCPNVVRILTVTKKRYDLHWFDLWRRCVGTRWDLVVDLRGSGTSFFLWARRRRILRGGRRPGMRIGHHAELFRLSRPLMPKVWTTPAHEAVAGQLLPDGKKWLALAPTANWDGKIWPASNFVALGQLLRGQGFVPAIFYGPGEGERSRALPVLAALDGAEDVGGDRPIGEVAALLKRCALFVGNDSGLMHLAAAAGAPTLGLFGPSRASEYAPSGPRAAHVVAPGPEGAADIRGLDVATVHKAACGMLAHER